MFNPYKKDSDPYQSVTQSQLPHKQISEEEIQENIKKVMKNSNLKNADIESASWANDDGRGSYLGIYASNANGHDGPQ